MRHYRRTASCWLISQALCFCLLLQGSGIAQASLPPQQTFVSRSELELARSGTIPDSGEPAADRPLRRLAGALRGAAEEAGDSLRRWLRDRWSEAAAEQAMPVQVAQAGGVLPLPPRLMTALLASSSRGQVGPPNPPGLGAGPTEKTPPAEIARLAEKVASEEIPLLAGWNLISIPEQPADPDPAAVFGAIAGELAKVSAYDACDTADPWKVYDPAEPAASDLTAVDHKIGMWVKATGATVLPSDGSLPAATALELCEGWNLIGFPAGEPRHPHVALSSIAGKWQRIFAYDAFDPEDPWEIFSINRPDWANDLRFMHPGRGYWVLTTEAATLEIRNHGAPPTVAIATPADLAVTTEPTEIVGTVESDRLASWTLTSTPVGDGEPVTLATGNTPVAGGTLATFDPTLLLNGLYELELTATDVQGQQVTESIAVSVEGQMKIGHFTLSFVDLSIPVSGLDIEIVRTYDSRDKQQRDFGVGWSLDVRQGSYRNNRPPGDGWQLQTGFLPCDTVLESKSHLTVVRLSGQEFYRFALKLADGTPTTGGCFATARFDFVDGLLPGTTLEILGNAQVLYENGSDRVIDADTFELYEPEDVRLATRDGRIFEFDLNDGVTRLEDLNGNQMSITPAGITHSSGRGITLERDAEGRILAIIDPNGESRDYTYDISGDLVSITNQEGGETRFAYSPGHLLLSYEDPRGVQALRNEYDEQGRLVRHIDAAGNETVFEHRLGFRQEVVTDRLGRPTVYEYDDLGNVIRQTNVASEVIESTYDANGDQTGTTYPLGGSIDYAYDSQRRPVSVDLPAAGALTLTYAANDRPETITDPRGGVTHNTFDAAGNVSRSQDPLGKAVVYTYDTRGHVASETDALGCTTQFEYDAFGNLTRRVDPHGNENVMTYDANGNRLTETATRTLPSGASETLMTQHAYDRLNRLTRTTYRDGSVVRTEYDAIGQVTAQIDELGRRVSFTYDTRGNLLRTTFPDGTFTESTYDSEGNELTSRDRAGRVFQRTYNHRNNVGQISFPDGSTVRRDYDAAGRLVAAVDQRGFRTQHQLDAAGRVLSTVDPLGERSVFTYDAGGNLLTSTDSLGFETTYAYDAANQLTRIDLPDGNTVQTVYDAAGRVTQQIDQAGKTTAFAYDCLGRLTRVTDAAGGETDYGYDEVGNLISITDAEGRMTSMVYDPRGRMTSRTLPAGQIETFTHDASGNVVSHRDFNGETTIYEYDTDNRLVRKVRPSGEAISFTYTPVGQRASVTDSRGTTTYSYDSSGRLTAVTTPDGRSVSYAYDAAGNRTQIVSPAGTVRYEFDALGRMSQVEDPEGNATALEYDAAGNMVAMTHGNGVKSELAYDPLRRLVRIAHRASDGTLLGSFDYTLGPTGDRRQVADQDGRTVSYAYDSVYRLLGETFSDGTSTTRNVAYNYDRVGNRLTHEDSTATPPLATYTYDANDRLLSAGARTFTYDANGNTLSASTAAQSASYVYNGDNLLVRAVISDSAGPSTTIDYDYDADGIRVRRAVADDVVDYLVDYNEPFPQVLQESDAAGTPIASYVYGPGPLSMDRGGQRFFFQADALASTRLLTDSAEAVTDSYEFDAFGQLVSQSGATENPYRYTGEQLDEALDLYYLRARYLDQSTGRFISADPFPGGLRDPFTLHQYAYVRNNPVNMTDPSGMLGLQGALLVATVVGILAGIAATFYGFHQYNDVPPFFRGIRIHEAIFKYYRSPWGFKCNNWIAKSDNPPIDRRRPDCRQHQPGPFFGEVYEIKPVTQVAKGTSQLARYVTALRKRYPTVPWRFGPGPLLAPSPLPKSDLPHWPFIRIHLSIPMRGIIVYTARPDWPEVIRIGISAFVATMLVYFINSGAGAIRVTRPFPRPIPGPA